MPITSTWVFVIRWIGPLFVVWSWICRERDEGSVGGNWDRSSFDFEPERARRGLKENNWSLPTDCEDCVVSLSSSRPDCWE